MVLYCTVPDPVSLTPPRPTSVWCNLVPERATPGERIHQPDREIQLTDCDTYHTVSYCFDHGLDSFYSYILTFFPLSFSLSLSLSHREKTERTDYIGYSKVCSTQSVSTRIKPLQVWPQKSIVSQPGMKQRPIWKCRPQVQYIYST